MSLLSTLMTNTNGSLLKKKVSHRYEEGKTIIKIKD